MSTADDNIKQDQISDQQNAGDQMSTGDKLNAGDQKPQDNKIEIFTSLPDIAKAISTHYKFDEIKIKFITPSQIVDGAAVEFRSDGNPQEMDFPQVLATARLRFLNKMFIEKTAGSLSIEVVFTDISYTQNVVDFQFKKIEEVPKESIAL